MQRPQVTGVAESNNPGPERVEHFWAPPMTRARKGVMRVLDTKNNPNIFGYLEVAQYEIHELTFNMF